MDEKLRFHILVMLLAETYEIEDHQLWDELDIFENPFVKQAEKYIRGLLNLTTIGLISQPIDHTFIKISNFMQHTMIQMIISQLLYVPGINQLKN